MIKIASLSTIAGALLAFGLSAAPAAAATQTWVSGLGTNGGACTRAAPCRTFAQAIGVTAAGGEIDVVDSGDYGPVTITKAISIVNDGAGVAGIQVSSGNAITINAGAGGNVYLRGLTIQGLGSNNGIEFDAGNLEIENCVIRNFGNGIVFAPGTSSSSFLVSNTIAANNANSGIEIVPIGSGAVTGVLSKVTANNNYFGFFVAGSPFTKGSSNVTIDDSEASNNAQTGVHATSEHGAATAVVMLRNSVASYSGTGLQSQGTAILRVAHSVVTGNNRGVFASGGGIIDSYGDNDIDGNTNNNTGVLTHLATH